MMQRISHLVSLFQLKQRRREWLQHFKLDQSVFLRSHTLAGLAIVIGTRLLVRWREDSQTDTKHSKSRKQHYHVTSHYSW